MRSKIRVLVIEDSALMRLELTRIVNSDPELHVVGTARDGSEGLEKVKSLDPEVVTLDINLPDMDGLTCLQYIMLEAPRPCIIISAYTGNDSIETFEALELGAVDFVEKPSGEISRDIEKRSREIAGKIKDAVYVNLSAMMRQEAILVDQKKIERPSGEEIPNKIVVIGVSTGGPRALMQLVPALPYDLNAPVLVVQHMPGGFTRKFAERLNSHSFIEVREARNGEPLQNSMVYVAPGDSNLELIRNSGNILIALSRPPKSDFAVPSVEKAIDSAIDIFGKRTVGVILTGMGNDGAKAMKRLHKLGGETVAEAEETAVIYGMPKEAISRGAIKTVAPVYEIAERIVEAVSRLCITEKLEESR